ncbi:homeobox-leucine zipper protein ROC7 isoform X2 [Sorghum bicolor]|uniref:homeobox-leucine zipper protein ROC7 isoform X2 n=1 Tax=Sorghum bicolor TaxID=4558 RepID=UPI000B426317|nr:homeobox-leucine zipper protein ROC7 isoform X2 [Sorghum bicolor]|eukprot:XP_021319954.1 homeobox-leucine zipper protein ROC7 isoform X2 [Sorghum bicolor]
MPGGLMIPGRNMPTAAAMIGGLASYAASLGQNMMDGHHQLAMMQQQQHQNHGQQQQHPPQAATSESDARGPRHDELMMESKSGSDNMEGGAGSGSGGEELQEDLSLQPARKKRYHRHTQHQIQELEAFFKEYPHPDDKQRKELSRELGLEPLQVKFWFQNKRTQMKTQQERHENMQLRAENEKLRAENARYKDALANASCPNCGGPATAVIGEMSFDEHHLRIENARLRDEVDRISTIAAKYVGKPADMFGGLHLHGAAAGFDKGLVVELAVAAMEELVRMAQLGEPLWIPALVVDGATIETLNEEEYARGFPSGVGPKLPELRSEASRETVVVIMNHVNLIEMLMDVNQWSTLFSSIVSRAATLEVLSTGVAGNYNGALQLMTAEFQMPSPLVPTRESQFLRYCKQHTDGSWAVVDVSVEGLRASGQAGARGRRRPSGCLIQEMPNGYSRVTWVEHVEADDMMVHDLYRPLVCSGLAFGARRWAAALERQCERLASAMASGVPAGPSSGGDAVGVVTSVEGRRSMLRLAERMVTSFCGGVTASTTHQWTKLSGSGAEDVRVMTRKSVDDPGRPPGIILNAATSFWLPVPPARVFGFLRDDATRSEWDILSNGGDVQEMAHIANGRDHGNAVSLLRVNNANSNQSNMLILQECCTDATGSYVIYAPVDVVAMNVVLNGGDPDYVALLPSGFAILPDGSGAGGAPPGFAVLPDGPGAGGGGGGGGGSLLTVAFQILVDSVPTAKLSLGSVATVNSLIACTVERIKAAVAADNIGGGGAVPQ